MPRSGRRSGPTPRPSCTIGGPPRLAGEWPTLVADARAFLATWGLTAARLGWPAWALWGVHREVPGSWRGRELVALLHGRPVVAVTATEAVIRTPDGKVQTYRRPGRDRLHPEERALLWELA